MFRNHKELVDFGKDWNLFQEISYLDNVVEDGFQQIANFPFRYQAFKSFDETFRDSTKLSQTLPSKIQKNSVTPRLGRG